MMGKVMTTIKTRIMEDTITTQEATVQTQTITIKTTTQKDTIKTIITITEVKMDTIIMANTINTTSKITTKEMALPIKDTMMQSISNIFRVNRIIRLSRRI